MVISRSASPPGIMEEVFHVTYTITAWCKSVEELTRIQQRNIPVPNIVLKMHLRSRAGMLYIKHVLNVRAVCIVSVPSFMKHFVN